jgi:hypothetical protein
MESFQTIKSEQIPSVESRETLNEIYRGIQRSILFRAFALISLDTHRETENKMSNILSQEKLFPVIHFKICVYEENLLLH